MEQPSQSTHQSLANIPLSVLDLSPIVEGSTAAESFRRTADLARHAEAWGYQRYWLAEHHNMPGIASSATSVLIGHVAANTSTIRVGSGGIMLPNHAPIVIAEQFGTLESLYPNRIDLGLGRAPGSDQLTAQALRRDTGRNGQEFPELLDELRNYLRHASPLENRVRAVPGEGLHIPIWLLGSSGFSARLAGDLGLPFAFASHFSPENTRPALEVYRNHFQPSEVLDAPYVIVTVNAIAADTDEEAERLATSSQQQFLSLIRNRPQKLQPPVDSMEELWSEYEKMLVQRTLSTSIIGSPATVKRKLTELLESTNADEIMINSQIYDHDARLRSFEILNNVRAE
ncbi:LLM class flavin-dependent oxidoreductase [Paenibacillus sp. SC116]|uniref:LLM class flavin-dependent oxidoreductase n=1 Tax=Paenibacillus sp. SC116 TaxID=2968986 RepID=UPI00215B0707|nr:LLM class flavin-dependent oxidoreductase [Paenibacillus sp. SC116]MCR8842234.1 LLM class flavin-dependent oxidoreductase [Paenibacillus sp. SC116]